MKTLLIAILLSGFGLVGCASHIPYSNEERCALNGMKLVGVNYDSANSMAYGYNTGSIAVTTYGQSLRCDAPANQAEKMQIKNINKALAPINSYNNSVKTKKLLTGMGYVLYIAPGIALKLMYDGEYDKAVQDSEKIKSELYSEKPAQANAVPYR